MPEIAYDHFDWVPQPKAQAIIDYANDVCERYARQGLDLTLRQVYYQFISADLLPNTEKSYNSLGNTLSKARMAGMLDWDYITDRGRVGAPGLTRDSTPDEHVMRAVNWHSLDIWSTQETRVEVWVEKDALSQVIEQAASPLGADTFACKGYVSSSAMWQAAQRFSEYALNGQKVVIVHLGDHDPSGIDMTRDIKERLSRFMAGDFLTERGYYGDEIAGYLGKGTTQHTMEGVLDWASEAYELTGEALTIERIALNMDQIRQYTPPPNPAKVTDSRAKDYIERYGRQSWELDALDPSILNNLIQTAIRGHLDVEKFNERVRQQEAERDLIREAATTVAERMRAVREAQERRDGNDGV